MLNENANAVTAQYQNGTQNGDFAGTAGSWYQGEQHVCPNCGRCPCCGRGGYDVQPIYPWQPTTVPYPNPWGGPYWGLNGIGTVTCGQSSQTMPSGGFQVWN